MTRYGMAASGAKRSRRLKSRLLPSSAWTPCQIVHIDAVPGWKERDFAHADACGQARDIADQVTAVFGLEDACEFFGTDGIRFPVFEDSGRQHDLRLRRRRSKSCP